MLNVMVLSLLLIGIGLTTGTVFKVISAIGRRCNSGAYRCRGVMNAEQFNSWFETRKGDFRFVAGLNTAKNVDRERLSHLFTELSESQSFYDTIYYVDPEGNVVGGVDNLKGSTQVFSEDAAADFQVADRAWFREAISGKEVFLVPLVSLSTCNTVANVVTPVRNN